MTTATWQLQTPADAIIFDCDGTLSALEGIDELAKTQGVGDVVQQLTADAMGTFGLNPTLYQQRLDLVRPTQKQILALGAQYFAHCTPDVYSVIQLFKRLGKKVYIVSAGLYPAVAAFAQLLHVPEKHVFAVQVEYNAQGLLIDFDQTSPLIHNDGKRIILEELKRHHHRMIYVGDGLNDYAVHDLVTRFIGFGGVFYRENIAASCEYYIKHFSMAPLLPLALTLLEYEQLNSEEQALYAKGLSMLS